MGEIAMNLLHEMQEKWAISWIYEIIWAHNHFSYIVRKKISFLIQRKNKDKDYSFVIEAVEEGH